MDILDGQLQQITLRATPHPMTVYAHVYGDLAIHADFRLEGFIIVHVPTGYAIPEFVSQRYEPTFDLLRDLAALNWNFDSIDDRFERVQRRAAKIIAAHIAQAFVAEVTA